MLYIVQAPAWDSGFSDQIIRLTRIAISFALYLRSRVDVYRIIL